MSGILDGVDQRTQLAGHNRLELLLFRLNGTQLYGINVFKVQEVMEQPEMTQIPQSHAVVKGVAHLRGKTIPVLDLSMAIGAGPLKEDGFLIVSEYNLVVQGFLVGAVDRIVNLTWSDIKPPPKGVGDDHYLTAVSELDGELIEVIDVEKVMKEVMSYSETISEGVIDDGLDGDNEHILIVDDSSVARNQIKRVVETLGIGCTLANDGQEGLDVLRNWINDGKDLTKFLTMIISDIEMPVMDGYTMTTEIRNDPALSSLYIVLHTSLSGVFNQSMVEKVGANSFLPKFKPDELARLVQDRVKARSSEQGELVKDCE